MDEASHTRHTKTQRKENGTSLASSRCWPLAWPSRGKMGARLGGRTHSIVVGDLSSTHQRDWSAMRVPRTPSWWRANQSDKLATASGERGSSTEKRNNRSLPHAHREQKREENEPAQGAAPALRERRASRERTAHVLLFLLRGPRPLSPPIFPALFSAPPSLRGVRSSPRRGLQLWRVHISKGVRQKKGGKPARAAVVSPPRPIRLRSRPLFTAERPAAWPVEDGVRRAMSGGDGGVVWWSSVVECGCPK